jgi:hypothetical protein
VRLFERKINTRMCVCLCVIEIDREIVCVNDCGFDSMCDCVCNID